VPNNIKQLLLYIKGEIGSNTIIVGDSITHFWTGDVA
jgi:hypothetical protein